MNALTTTATAAGSGGPYTRKAYSLLAMPVADGPDALRVGQFCPADSEPVVHELSRMRVQQLKNLGQVRGLHPYVSHVIREMRFHTFEDFLMTTRHEIPRKGDYVDPGHSLATFSEDLSGYLGYLRENADDLHGFLHRRFPVRIPEKERERHTYVLGASGSGKSELLKVLIHSSMTQKKGECTIIFIDPHGDTAEEIGKFQENRDPDSLIYIDPFLDEEGKRIPVINPLELKDCSPENVDYAAQSLMGAFREILEASFTLQMETLLFPCLSVLLQRPGSTLVDLMRFMDDSRNEDLVEAGKQLEGGTQADFFENRFFQRNFAPTKESLSSKIQNLLNSKAFYSLVTGEGTFDIEQVINSRKLVIFNLAKGKLGSDTSEAFGRFLVALIQSSILKRANEPKERRVPVHLIVDEFQNYTAPRLFEEILSESRKYHLAFSACQQYLGQRMDFSFKRAILANTQVKMIGMSAKDSRAAAAQEIGIDEKKIAELSVGEFFVKVGSRPAYKLYVPEYLINKKNSMSQEEWIDVKRFQLEKYYQCVTSSFEAVTKCDIPNETVTASFVEGTDSKNANSKLSKEKKRIPKPKLSL